MRRISISLATLLMVVAAFSSAWSQTGEKVATDSPDRSQAKPKGAIEESTGALPTTAQLPLEPAVWIHLIDGRRFQADDLTEQRDGFWFKRGNISTFLEREKVARVERVSAIKDIPLTDPLRGSGT